MHSGHHDNEEILQENDISLYSFTDDNDIIILTKTGVVSLDANQGYNSINIHKTYKFLLESDNSEFHKSGIVYNPKDKMINVVCFKPGSNSFVIWKLGFDLHKDKQKLSFSFSNNLYPSNSFLLPNGFFLFLDSSNRRIEVFDIFLNKLLSSIDLKNFDDIKNIQISIIKNSQSVRGQPISALIRCDHGFSIAEFSRKSDSNTDISISEISQHKAFSQTVGKDQKSKIVSAFFKKDELIIRTSSSATDNGEIALSLSFPLFREEHGFPIQIFMDQSTGVDRFLIVSSDYSLSLIENNKILWCREESLSSIIGAHIFDLPSDYSKDRNFSSLKEYFVFNNFYQRSLDHLKTITDFFKLKPIDGNINTIHNRFGFIKNIIISTSSGKIFSLKTSSGEVL